MQNPNPGGVGIKQLEENLGKIHQLVCRGAIDRAATVDCFVPEYPDGISPLRHNFRQLLTVYKTTDKSRQVVSVGACEFLASCLDDVSACNCHAKSATP